MGSDESARRVAHGRQITDGLPPKAQIVYALTAITAGAALAVYFKGTGMDSALALPLGLFIGITAVSAVAFMALVVYCRPIGGEHDD